MAKQRSIGGIYASLTLRDKGFKKGLDGASKSLSSFGAGAASLAAGGVAALAAAGVAIGAGMLVGTTKTLAAMDDLGDAAAQTGVAIGDMMKLQQAYKDGGREASMAGKDIGKMQKAIVEAASGGADPFKELGLNAVELLKLDPARQFNTIGEAIMRISNPAERTAKAMEVFGKGGMGLTTVFEGLPAAEKALGRMPQLADKFGSAMGEANDLIGHLPLKSDQFFTGFTSGIIGEILPNLKKIDEHDFTALGENIGKAMSMGFKGMTDGTLFEIFSLKAMASTMELAADIGKTIAAGINAGLDMGESAISKKFEHFGDFLGDTIVGLAGGDDVKARWNEIKNREIEKRNAAQGFSPLGGGAPVEEKGFFERFSEYQKKLGTEMINGPVADLRADADTLWNRLQSSYMSGQSAAAALSEKPEITDPITDLAAKALAAKTPEKMDANEYQRRGLSLDGGPAAVKQDKQISLMTEMTKYLKTLSEKKPSGAF